MRLRHAAVAAALTVFGVAGCGDDTDDPAPVAPAPSVSAGPSTAVPPGAGTAPADPGTPPTEGTATVQPPKKGGEPAQGPAGKPPVAPR